MRNFDSAPNHYSAFLSIGISRTLEKLITSFKRVEKSIKILYLLIGE